MNTEYLIDSLVDIGVNLEVTENGKLVVDSDQGFLSSPQFEYLKIHKSDVVQHLREVKARQLIQSLYLKDDRVFVSESLVGIFGSNRLNIVNEYLEQWQLGKKEQPVEIKKENAGRYRANTWLRDNFK